MSARETVTLPVVELGDHASAIVAGDVAHGEHFALRMMADYGRRLDVALTAEDDPLDAAVLLAYVRAYARATDGAR